MPLLLLLMIIFGYLGFVILSTVTYTISPENLILILSGVDENNLAKYYDFSQPGNPALIIPEQFDNGIKEIQCIDKKGALYLIKVNKRTQIRITRKGGTKQIMYFDTIFTKSDLFYGSKTHFPKLPLKPVPAEEITRVELQFKRSGKLKMEHHTFL